MSTDEIKPKIEPELPVKKPVVPPWKTNDFLTRKNQFQIKKIQFHGSRHKG